MYLGTLYPIGPMSEPTVLTLPRMARRLGVTQAWLRELADAGRIPSVSAGAGRFLFNPDAVEAALSALAAQGPTLPQM